jgi:hypothetical protein
LYILMSEQAQAISVTRLDDNQSVAPLANLWTLTEVHSYEILNHSETQVSVLLLEINASPGRVVCSGGNACPWSIREVDPAPVFLSDHLTIFKIPLPWAPEAHSVIVPTVDVAVNGAHRDAWNAVWMETGDEVKPLRQKERWPVPRFDGAFPVPVPYLLEIAFYDRPFCYCKRVRREN